MKKSIVMALAAISTLAICSCGFGAMGAAQQGATTQQQTQQPVGNIGNVLGGITGIGDILSSVLGVTTTDIVGTWTYQEPAVLFESDNLLAKAGGQYAAKSMVAKLDTYFQKAGITKGKMSMTFDKQGNFTQTIGTTKRTGTYTVENGQVKLAFQSGHGQIVGTTQFDGNNLVIVVDMTKLMTFAQTVSAASSSTQLQGLSSILSNVNGMKAGLKFKK